MAEVQVKPTVRCVIFADDVAGLWASVPQFGIRGWTWCVGGALLEDAHNKAVEELRLKIRQYCDTIVSVGGVAKTMSKQRELARQVLKRGFELVEDPSIATH